MVTIVCKLTLPDGAVIEGKLEAASPDDQYPIQWKGPTERLPDFFDKCDPGFLPFIFKDAAKEIGGELEIKQAGQYENWAT